jgi:uncharacterized membrane protein YfhO
MLVISEPYIRGWTATVDGQPVTLYHADAALMAVGLPAGSHRVVLQYHQPGLRLGLALAAAALLLATAVLLLSCWPGRRRVER